MPGRPLGTANYMAPERILQLPLDPAQRSVLAGVVMFEMATGRLPFAGASPGDTVTNVLDQRAAGADDAVAPHPQPLEQVVMRLLAKDAAARFQSAGLLRTALEPLASTAPSRVGRAWRKLVGGQSDTASRLLCG